MSASLAILYDDPVQVASEQQRSDLCAPIGPDVAGSGDVRTKEIGGWLVAAIPYEGERNAARAFEEVYGWLREQGYSPADVPVVKYLSQFGRQVRAQIGVPVIKRELMPGAKKIRASAAKRATTRRLSEKSATRKKAATKRTRRIAKK